MTRDRTRTAALGILYGTPCPSCGFTIVDVPLPPRCPACGFGLRTNETEVSVPDEEYDQALVDLLSDPSLTDRFIIGEKLGQGGMGALFTAHDRKLDRPVALKFTLQTDSAHRARFLREGQMLAQLSHPNILKVFSAEIIADLPVLVLELLVGETVASELERSGSLSVLRSAGLMEATLDGLSAAHDAGVIHRDLKPQNLLMAVGGVLKILDFGLARRYDEDGRSSSVTCTGTVLGTPAYMSPEQCRGEDLDCRSDLYQVGVIFFQFVTGRLPFLGETTTELLAAHVHEEPPDPAVFVPELPPGLSELILRALSKDPARRHESAAAMLKALMAVPLQASMRVRRPGSGRVATPLPPTLAVEPSQPRVTVLDTRPTAAIRVRRRAALIVGLVVVVVALGMAAWWFLHRPIVTNGSGVASPSPVPAVVTPSAGHPVAVTLGHVHDRVPEIVPGRSFSLLQFRSSVPCRLSVWAREAPRGPRSQKSHRRTVHDTPLALPADPGWTRIANAGEQRRVVHRIQVRWPASGQIRQLVVTEREELSPAACRASFVDVRLDPANVTAVLEALRGFRKGGRLENLVTSEDEALNPMRHAGAGADEMCEPPLDLRFAIPKRRLGVADDMILLLTNRPDPDSENQLAELLRDLHTGSWECAPNEDRRSRLAKAKASCLVALTTAQREEVALRVWQTLRDAVRQHPAASDESAPTEAVACLSAYAAFSDRIHQECRDSVAGGRPEWRLALRAIMQAGRSDRQSVLEEVREKVAAHCAQPGPDRPLWETILRVIEQKSGKIPSGR